jgi:tetratricopeptide (TPR) repeat protein
MVGHSSFFDLACNTPPSVNMPKHRYPTFAKRLLPITWALAACVAQAATPVNVNSAEQSSELDGRLFYQILAGEIASRQGDNGLAFRFIAAAAKNSDDEQLSARAVEIAMQAGAGDAAWGAVNDWVKRQPESQKAQAMKLRVAIATNRLNGVTEALTKIIAQSSDTERREIIRAIPSTLSRLPQALLKKADEIAQTSLKTVKKDRELAAAAWAAIGTVRLNTKDTAGALRALAEAYKFRPADLDAGRLALNLMEQGVAAAEPLVVQHIDALTDKTNARFSYARLLFIDNRLTPALNELERLLSDSPAFIAAWLLKGQIELQQSNFPAAGAAAERALSLNEKEMAAAKGNDTSRSDLIDRQSRLLLADIAQAQSDWVSAEQWLAAIPADDDVSYRKAVLMGKQGRFDDALSLLDGPRASEDMPSADATKNRMQLKVRWLREFNRTADAYQLSSELTAAFPDDPEILYSQAMLAEQLGKHAEMETILRALIAKRPDYSHAYNALGYSLVDRGERLPEAQALIEEALRLSPNDPLITDSLGWAYFRQGNLADAARTLQKAYGMKQDPEIAAHLGEVWWKLGQTQSAEKLLRDAQRRYPNNTVLIGTFKRLGITP